MSLKSISPTFPPHVGSGFFSHTPSEWRRNARIQSGSDFMWEIVSTISRSSPFRDLNAYSSGSWNPYLYWSRSMPSGFVTAMMRTPPANAAPKTPAAPALPWAGPSTGIYSLLSLWGILDRRQPWAFRFQRAEVRTNEVVVPFILQVVYQTGWITTGEGFHPVGRILPI